MATTTTNGFDTISQAGSGITWSGLSNMEYPTEGTASASLTAGVQFANRINMYSPHEAADIPNGAKFVSMQLNLVLKKTGIYSASTNLEWSGRTGFSGIDAWSYTHTIDETEQSVNFDGDQAYWQIPEFYSPTDIIDGFRGGYLPMTIDVESTVAIACGARVRAATIAITYDLTEGKRGAIIAALL